jgi:N-acetylmuramoyl-L-alanine amidase
MRDIKYLVVHCSATDQSATVEAIKDYWKNTLGWKNPGYHVIIKPDGDSVELLSPDKIANGVRGENRQCMHVCYIGGKNYDDRTTEQKNKLIAQLSNWKAIWPEATIQGHRDFHNVAKACPQFDAKTEYSWI